MDKQTFEEFKADWLKKHPASVPVEEVEESPYPRWARALCFASFITSALASGVHTMTVVYGSIALSAMVDETFRQWVARGAFVSYELGLFLAAFLMIVQQTRRLAQMLATIIFLTLIAVNLYSVLKVYGFDLQNDPAGAGVTAFFALVPVIAYASGKLYVNIGVAERALKKRAKEALQKALKALDATINREYTKYVKDYETSRNDFMKSGEVGTLHESSRNPVKPRVKLHEVAEEIYENGDAGLSVAEMMERYGISQGSTTKIRDMLKQRTNGNGHKADEIERGG